MPVNTTTAYRDYYRRIHRLIAQYSLLCLYANKLNFIVIKNNDIMRFMKIKKGLKVRIKWIIDDLGEYYPNIVLKKTKHGVGNYYCSNTPFPKEIKNDKTILQNRLLLLNSIGYKGQAIKLPAESYIIEKISKYYFCVESLQSFIFDDDML